MSSRCLYFSSQFVLAVFLKGKNSSSEAVAKKPAALEIEHVVSWIDGPYVGVKKHRSNHFRIQFQNKIDPSLKPEIENFDFWPFMKIHGHGAGGEVKINRLSSYEFDLSGFIFTMSGPWELEIRYSYLGVNHALSIPIML